MNIKQIPARTKNFVVRHKTAVAIVATTTVCYLIHKEAIDEHNEFLTEHGLFDAYYHPEEN